jgi:Family of unknown function (DUF6535)
MALVFSLSAALATLVQQWVRDYMHVFLRYNDPLKSARLRQYLHEGLEGWYMPLVAETVPGFIHVALFLFFAGLCDLVLNINTGVGCQYDDPYRDQWIAVRRHDIRSDISTVAIQKSPLGPYLAFNTEITWTKEIRSRDPTER